MAPAAHPAPVRLLFAVLAASAMLLAACVNPTPTGGGGPLGVEAGDGQAPISSPLGVEPAAAAARDCAPRSLDGDVTVADSPTSATLRISQAIFPCAEEVVVAANVSPAIVAGSAYAVDRGAHLLVVDVPPSPQQLDELARLEPAIVHAFDVDAAAVGGRWDVVEVDVDEDASEGPVDDPATTTTRAPSAADERTSDQVWLVGAGTSVIVAAAPAAAVAGAELIAVEAQDLRALDAATRARVAGAETTRLIGPFGLDASWQLEVVRTGVEIPGGGQLVFPGRRFVALYGSPLTSRLGVLGEQGPEATLDRLLDVSAGFETGDGVTVVPTFEIIATVASGEAGPDGDYSTETPVEDLRPWIDLAAREDIYVVLDLQSGRTDFLTQAKRYEELLRLPHVGLAIDPEWRLRPDQVHLEQVGSVTGAEVNTVSEWLAGIVREAALPQKLFIVHQFKPEMITEREAIEAPPELAVVIQVDGQGPLPTKYRTYEILTSGAEDAVWRWGWKNFYDEDSPMATPEQTLAVDPPPVFISYQ
jgi:hypothetical protein